MDTVDTIEANMQALIRAVKHSQEYLNFKTAEQELSVDPQLKQRVDKFRLHNFESQGQATEPQIFDIMDELSHESEELHKIPLAHNYLQAELALCRLLQNISRELVHELDMHIPAV